MKITSQHERRRFDLDAALGGETYIITGEARNEIGFIFLFFFSVLR